MSKIDELKDRIERLEHTVSLLVADTDMPIIRTVHENDISESELNEIHNVFEYFSLLEQTQGFTRDDIINKLTALECISRSKNPAELAHEVIIGMGVSNRWTNVYYHYVKV